MTKKLIQSSHPGRKTFKKLYEQEKFIKLTQDQFFAESETVYTRSQTRLAIKHPSRIDHNVTPHAMGSASGHIKRQSTKIDTHSALTFDFFDLKACKIYPAYKFQKTMSLPARKAHELLDSLGQSILVDCLSSWGRGGSAPESAPISTTNEDAHNSLILPKADRETATINVQWQNKTNGKILPAERASHSSTNVTKDKYKQRTKIKTLRVR